MLERQIMNSTLITTNTCFFLYIRVVLLSFNFKCFVKYKIARKNLLIKNNSFFFVVFFSFFFYTWRPILLYFPSFFYPWRPILFYFPFINSFFFSRLSVLVISDTIMFFFSFFLFLSFLSRQT